MSTHHVTFEFAATVGVAATSGSGAGWSESWYDPADLSDVAAANKAAFQLAPPRISLLTPGWTMTSIRVASLDVHYVPTRKGHLIYLPPANGKGRYNAAVPTIDEQAYDALNFAVNSISGYRRSFLMRGIGNDLVNAGGRFLNPAAFPDAYLAWSNALTGVGADFGAATPYAIRYRTGVGNDVTVGVLIAPNAANPAASPLTPALIFPDPVAMTNPDLVTVRGASGWTGLNGVWTVKRMYDILGPPITHVYLLASKRRATVAGAGVANVKVAGFRYALDPIATATPGNGASRRTGRPPGLIRGRRSSRV